MTDKEYLEGTVNRTWRKDHRALTPSEAELIHALLGLVGEAGELADNVKKLLFLEKDSGEEARLKELGDIQYYVTKLADLMKSTLEEVKRRNAAKLAARYPNGFVPGGGIREGEGA